MNKCTHVRGHDGYNLVCDADAPYVINGASVCQEHYYRLMVGSGLSIPIYFGEPEIEVPG